MTALRSIAVQWTSVQGAVVAKSLIKFSTRIGDHIFEAPLTGGELDHGTWRSNERWEAIPTEKDDTIQLSSD